MQSDLVNDGRIEMGSPHRSSAHTPVIKTVNLQKTYGEGDAAVKALRGIDVTVNQGEFVAVMGPSGSGKSTLLHVLGCLHKSTGGSYELAGIHVEDLNDNELSKLRNQKVGIVFQKFNLLSQESIVRNVELPLVYAGVSKKERERRAIEILERLGLGHRLKHSPTELSGGEDQRVAISRALVSNPAVILADEPTGNLDTRTGEEVMNIFEQLHKEGRTIVMITHARDIAEHARRIIHIKDGLVDGEEILDGTSMTAPSTASAPAIEPKSESPDHRVLNRKKRA